MDPNKPQQPNPQPQSSQQPPIDSTPLSSPSENQAGLSNSSSALPPAGSNQAQNKKTSMIRNIIAILLLLFMPLFGLIFVWFLTNWPKKVKYFLIFLFFILPIIIVLFSVVIIAIRPNGNVDNKADTNRRSEQYQILNSIGRYKIDNKGELPAGITSVEVEISSEGADICSDLVKTYLPSLPVDPLLGEDGITDCTSNYRTGYYVMKNNNGTITVSAPNTTGDYDNSVTR